MSIMKTVRCYTKILSSRVRCIPSPTSTHQLSAMSVKAMSIPDPKKNLTYKPQVPSKYTNKPKKTTTQSKSNPRLNLAKKISKT